MFLKTDKKILIMLVVIILVSLLAGVFIFKYLKETREKIQEYSKEEATGDQEELDENFLQPQEEEQPSFEVEISNPEAGAKPGFFICQDKCGDGVCQISGQECQEEMNCACLETKEECPADCK
ncbi:MAG: hypothetical protein AAB361_02110 [Patescibacteria group bacterium]